MSCKHNSVKQTVVKALKALGHKAEGGNVHIVEISYCRYQVYCNAEYIGIWDTQRNTFVD